MQKYQVPPPLFKLFQAWFVANNVGDFNFPEHDKYNLSVKSDEIIAMGKNKFSVSFLPLLTKAWT